MCLVLVYVCMDFSIHMDIILDVSVFGNGLVAIWIKNSLLIHIKFWTSVQHANIAVIKEAAWHAEPRSKI